MSDPGAEDRDARFTRLLGEFGPSLDRLAAAYEAEPAERDDLLQDISFALWRALPSFRGECTERTFVYRIAHNRGLAHRARRRIRAAEPLDAANPLPDPDADPDRDLERALGREQLLAAVRQLPDSFRQVVTLSLSGLSGAEIGEVLGISENNAAARLSRARRVLRSLL